MLSGAESLTFALWVFQRSTYPLSSAGLPAHWCQRMVLASMRPTLCFIRACSIAGHVEQGFVQLVTSGDVVALPGGGDLPCKVLRDECSASLARIQEPTMETFSSTMALPSSGIDAASWRICATGLESLDS